MFARILSNLERHTDGKAAAANTNLKYIMANANCDDRDIKGFIDICLRLRVGSVNLSPEIYENKDQQTSKRTLRQMAKFAESCERAGIPVTVMYELGDGVSADFVKARREDLARKRRVWQRLRRGLAGNGAARP